MAGIMANSGLCYVRFLVSGNTMCSPMFLIVFLTLSHR